MSGRKTCKVLFFPTLVVSKALSDIFFPGLVCSFAVLALVTLHYHISCDVIPTSYEYEIFDTSRYKAEAAVQL